MDLERSQKIVKVLGILDIIAAVICIISAVGMFGLGGVAVSNVPASGLDADTAAVGIGAIIAVGIIMLIEGVVDLLEGIFAVRAGKDASKVGPLWVFAIIAVILGVLSLISSIVQGQQVFSNILSLIINCIMLYLANNIKKLSNS